MKSLITILFLSLSFQMFAHTTVALNKATLKSVEDLRSTSIQLANALNKRYEHIGGGTVFNAYKLTKINPNKKFNESEVEFAERLVKSILHRDYPITGDDGGYSFNQIKFNLEADLSKYLSRNMEWIAEAEESAPFLKDFIKKTVSLSKESNVLILDGQGSGNNTIAYIFAVVDLKNNELFYIVDSNFGSDD